jgi:DNA replication protein DnaC
MNTQETILQLEELKLKGMAECYKSLQSLPTSEWPSADMLVARLAESEHQYRSHRKTEMYLKTSKLRYNTRNLLRGTQHHQRHADAACGLQLHRQG